MGVIFSKEDDSGEGEMESRVPKLHGDGDIEVVIEVCSLSARPEREGEKGRGGKSGESGGVDRATDL